MAAARRGRTNGPVEKIIEKELEDACQVVAFRAERMHEWLEPLLSERFVSKNPFAAKSRPNAYAFKSRLKPWYDIQSKVMAKRNQGGKPDYQADRVTDASGFRVVCLFNAEIPLALEAIFDLIDVPAVAGAMGQFADPPVREVLFYSSRPGGPLSILSEVTDLVTRRGYASVFNVPGAQAGQPASSYSSVHVVVQGEIHGGATPFAAFSEIQVRSVFEEAWGEISHRLKYAPAKRQRAQSAVALPEPEGVEGLWQHLDALKSLTDGCAQYADLINIQLLQRRAQQPPRNPKSTETPDESFRPFRACAAPVREAIERAFEIERQAESLPVGDVKKDAFFLDAGQKFADAVTALEASRVPAGDAERMRLANLLREEVGYCYYFSNDPLKIAAAETIFQKLLEVDPNNDIVLIRLAQITRDAGDVERARVLLESALTVNAAKRGTERRHAQRAWLLRRDLAYVLWRLVDRQPQRPDAVELLERAVELSTAAVKVAPGSNQQLGASMNMLYYLGDLYARLEGEQKEQVGRRAHRLLDDLSGKVEAGWTTEKLDTMMRAERTFGRPDKAREYAKVVLDRLKAKMSAQRPGPPISLGAAFQALSRDEQDMFLYAQDALADVPPQTGTGST